MARPTPIKDFIGLLLGLVAIGWTLTALVRAVYWGYYTALNYDKVFSSGMLFLMLGLAFESLRITKKWQTLAGLIAAALFFSSFYITSDWLAPTASAAELSMMRWPYIFLLVFAGLMALFYADEMAVPLSEGVLLIQSLSLAYLLADHGFWQITEWPAVRWVIGLMVAYTVFNALTPFVLSRLNRLVLSVWGAIAMLLLSFDNLWQAYTYQHFLAADVSWSMQALTALQFFLLGVSAVYIARNIGYLLGILNLTNPYDESSGHDYLVNRFSDRQASGRLSLIGLLLVATFYGLNYYYHALPRNVAIWLVFAVCPMLLDWLNAQIRRRRYR